MTGDLKVEVAPSQERYTAGEPVLVRVLVANEGEDDISLDRALTLRAPNGEGDVGFEVTTDAGESVPFVARVTVRSRDAGSTTVVPPGGVVGRLFDLGRYFPLEDPGRYRVRADYRAILSDPATFEIADD